MRQESENKGYIRKRLGGLGVVAAGAVAAAAIAYCAREQDSSPNAPDTTVEPTATARQLELPGAEEASPQAVIDLYNQTQDLNENYFDSRRQGLSQDDLRKVAIDLSVSKVRAMWASSHFPSDPFIKNEGNVVIFNNGRQFDLDKPTDFVIGTALADYFLHSDFQEVLEEEIGFVFNKQRLQSFEGFNNIFWLTDNVQIEMGDIPPIARTESLEKLSQGLQFLQEAGLPLPQKARIEYFGLEDKNIYENVDANTLLLQVYSFPDGDFRVRTSLTDYIIAKNPEVLKNYKERVSAVFDAQNSQITEPRLLSPSDYGYVYDDEGELPQVLADYIYDGVSFRKKIAYSMATDHIAEGSILQAKYDYTRELFSGVETSVDGRRHDVLNYNVGDVIEIEDYYDFVRPGIFLRETPTLEIDPNRPAVYDYQKVKIVEGPALYLDEVNLEATRMWRVQEGTVANDRVFVGDNDRNGWISEEWFGEKLTITN